MNSMLRRAPLRIVAAVEELVLPVGKHAIVVKVLQGRVRLQWVELS